MIVILAILAFISLLGACTLAYHMFQLVVLDAKSRDLKHPKFWGVFSLGGNNGSGGLILYLLGRNKYPSHMSDEAKIKFNSLKRRAGLSLCCITMGGIGMIFIALFGNL